MEPYDGLHPLFGQKGLGHRGGPLAGLLGRLEQQQYAFAQPLAFQ